MHQQPVNHLTTRVIRVDRSDLEAAIEQLKESVEDKFRNERGDVGRQIDAALELPRRLEDLLEAEDEPRSGLIARLHDSAQISALPKWARDLMAKAADALESSKDDADSDARSDPNAVSDGHSDWREEERLGLLRLRQLLQGFSVRVERNSLRPPATFLEEVQITSEFQPGVGSAIADEVRAIIEAPRNAVSANATPSKAIAAEPRAQDRLMRDLEWLRSLYAAWTTGDSKVDFVDHLHAEFVAREAEDHNPSLVWLRIRHNEWAATCDESELPDYLHSAWEKFLRELAS